MGMAWVTSSANAGTRTKLTTSTRTTIRTRRSGLNTSRSRLASPTDSIEEMANTAMATSAIVAKNPPMAHSTTNAACTRSSAVMSASWSVAPSGMAISAHFTSPVNSCTG